MPRGVYTQGKRGKSVDADKVLKALRDKIAGIENDKIVNVEVGYNTAYALYVHEDLTMNHPNGGQAKFLEEPARTQKQEINKIVVDELKKELGSHAIKGRLKQGAFSRALLKGGRFLEKESRKLVPVDTAFLKASSFTTLVDYIP